MNLIIMSQEEIKTLLTGFTADYELIATHIILIQLLNLNCDFFS